MSEPVIAFRGVISLVDRYPLLAGVDVTVEAGEVVLVTGANGAGKTSFLRACAGLVPITEGHAVVLGCDLARRTSDWRRSVGYLGHASTLYDELTVRENVRYAVRAAGSSADRVDASLNRLGLDGRLADVAVARLSAGQRRRAALAVLFARDPQLWLLDEPYTGLDEAARTVLDEEITAAAARHRTVVFSSHELQHGRHIATRHITINGGAFAGGDGAAAVVGADGKVPTNVA